MAQGLFKAALFISSRLCDASSSDYPPDKNMIPGTAGTTVLNMAITVFSPISLAETLALFGSVLPGVTILGLRSIPSKKMLLSCNALNTEAKTFYDTAKHLSIEWLPSDKISGSTIGTKPFA